MPTRKGNDPCKTDISFHENPHYLEGQHQDAEEKQMEMQNNCVLLTNSRTLH